MIFELSFLTSFLITVSFFSQLENYATSVTLQGDYLQAVKDGIEGLVRGEKEQTYTNGAIYRARQMYKKGANIGIRIADSTVNQIMIVLTDGQCAKKWKDDLDNELKKFRKQVSAAMNGYVRQKLVIDDKYDKRSNFLARCF